MAIEDDSHDQNEGAAEKMEGFELPPTSLLDYVPVGDRNVDRQAMLDMASRLNSTLAEYGVAGEVTEIHPGPVVTMYEFVPAAGTKLSKITALSDDLAMALEALKVRIVAPIPGKAAVGIEVPNRTRETVYLREIIDSEVFRNKAGSLPLALGKDIVGNPICVDLTKMPHLLIAGTSGSGKSVSVHAMICSMLFSKTPEDVQMIMIDPKMLELSVYEGIPHLKVPVVTDPKKAINALQWANDEMVRRYDAISKANVRDIGSYNKKIEKTTQANAESETLKKLPYIVIVIDEFADLMLVNSKVTEQNLDNLAKNGRAYGIHVIAATQRPSVDVLTGLIKANFPSRIAFQVASKIDARTILDQQGAESLLGMGDMLFTDRGLALKRIHGPIITDSEIHQIVEHLKRQGRPNYDLNILQPCAEEEVKDGSDEVVDDELYDQAVGIVSEMRQASTSALQRRLRIGYNRAARLIERMEREGLVSPADGARPREVLVGGAKRARGAFAKSLTIPILAAKYEEVLKEPAPAQVRAAQREAPNVDTHKDDSWTNVPRIELPDDNARPVAGTTNTQEQEAAADEKEENQDDENKPGIPSKIIRGIGSGVWWAIRNVYYGARGVARGGAHAASAIGHGVGNAVARRRQRRQMRQALPVHRETEHEVQPGARHAQVHDADDYFGEPQPEHQQPLRHDEEHAPERHEERPPRRDERRGDEHAEFHRNEHADTHHPIHGPLFADLGAGIDFEDHGHGHAHGAHEDHEEHEEPIRRRRRGFGKKALFIAGLGAAALGGKVAYDHLFPEESPPVLPMPKIEEPSVEAPMNRVMGELFSSQFEVRRESGKEYVRFGIDAYFVDNDSEAKVYLDPMARIPVDGGTIFASGSVECTFNNPTSRVKGKYAIVIRQYEPGKYILSGSKK